MAESGSLALKVYGWPQGHMSIQTLMTKPQRHSVTAVLGKGSIASQFMIWPDVKKKQTPCHAG